MRAYGALSPIDKIPLPPDTVQTMLLAAGTGQSFDWPNSTGGAAANAAENDCQLVRFTGMTSASAQLGFMVNLYSTQATVPTSGTSATTGTTAGSTGNSIPVLGSREFQVPGYSTGWSAISLTPGYVLVEIWKK